MSQKWKWKRKKKKFKSNSNIRCYEEKKSERKVDKDEVISNR